jgi:hypothetical protein
MPALLAYLIAVALFLGGGYGALSWLATPEPVKVVAKATPNPPPPRYADNPKPDSMQVSSPQVSPPEQSKPEAPGKPEISGADQFKAAANDKAVSSDQPPSASSSPQPEPPAVASQQEAKAEISGLGRDHRDLPTQVERPQTATDQGARHHAEAPPAEARQDGQAPARHEEGKQSTEAASPSNARTMVSVAPAAKATKRPHVRQASRGFDKRPLEMMTLRTIELPDGRRMTRLIPYRDRGGDRGLDDAPPAMVFGPDE